jgi:YegS/Rv2252/BmrU family lipid kinase
LDDTLFIINPVAAGGAALRTWAEAREEITRGGLQFDEIITTGPGQAAHATRDAIRSGAARVIAVGGDGTLSEVINGYLDEDGRAVDARAAVGLIPAGTGSDFRRTVGLGSWRDGARAVNGSKTKMIDAARVSFSGARGEVVTRSFINIASFGLGGDVSSYVNRWRETLPRWVGGRARFVAAAVRALGQFKSRAVTVTLDGGRRFEISSNLIVIANGRYAGGGMKLAPNARLDDGLFDVILTDRATRFDVIRELPRIGRGGYLKNRKVTESRAREVSIVSAEQMAIDIDGEMAGHTPARLVVLPSAVRFIV